MTNTLRTLFYGLVALAAFAMAPAASAAPATAEPSMAEMKYVLQISDEDPGKQTLVLNVANNLLKAYPPGTVDVEVVAFGPGLRLLFADNANNKRIEALAMTGVRFSACGNTLQTMTKILGEEPKLNGNAKVVSAGVVRIGELVKQGYILVKP